MVHRRLIKANSTKKDEFYTQLVDIENEMKYYKKAFRDKLMLYNVQKKFIEQVLLRDYAKSKGTEYFEVDGQESIYCQKTVDFYRRQSN